MAQLVEAGLGVAVLPAGPARRFAKVFDIRVLPLDELRVTRSLRQSCKRYEVRYDTCFREVMQHCGDPRRPHGWITPAFVDADWMMPASTISSAVARRAAGTVRSVADAELPRQHCAA